MTIEDALRELVKSIYEDCNGAYGNNSYEGFYEKEIQDLAKTIRADTTALETTGEGRQKNVK